MQSYRSEIEEELRRCFADRDGFLYTLLRYQLGWVNQQGEPEIGLPRKSFPSLLAPASCAALSGQYASALPVAAAVELVYNFSLAHGDLQAGRAATGDRLSIWEVWGPSQAINAGDGLHALSRAAMFRLKERGIAPDRALEAISILDQSCLALCEGQYMDLEFQDRWPIALVDYNQMIRNKTGALTGCAAVGGALVTGADQAMQDRFLALGSKLGMAWQITQDIDEFWRQGRGNATARNTLNKKKNLPIIYALENCGAAAKGELSAIYLKPALEPPDIVRIIQIAEEAGARTYAEGQAQDLVDQARQLLDAAAIPPARQEGLQALAEVALTSIKA